MKPFRLLIKIVAIIFFILTPVYLTQSQVIINNQQTNSQITKAAAETSAIIEKDGNIVCYQGPELASYNALTTFNSVPLKVITPNIANDTGRLKIIMRGTEQLEKFPKAKAAFLKAAATWESLINTPITIVIDVDYGPKFFGENFPPLGDFITLGLSTSQLLIASYPDVRSSLIDSASNPDELSLYNALPTDLVPTDRGDIKRVFSSSSLFRVYGKISADADPDQEINTLGPPPKIGFNSQNSFDFDPKDFISPNAYDFEGLALHEIGHVLGFNSNTGQTSPLTSISVWDLFRFRPSLKLDEFTSAQRILSAGGDQVFFYGKGELEVSTGITGGDGRQASHWKDNVFVGGKEIGVMDPIRNFGERTPVSINDLLALDLFGYKIADFALALNPDKLTVKSGDSGEIIVNIDRNNGYNGLVTVSVPNNKALKIKMKKVETSGSTISFKFKVKKNSEAGTKEIDVNAQDELGRIRTTKLTLEIQ